MEGEEQVGCPDKEYKRGPLVFIPLVWSVFGNSLAHTTPFKELLIRKETYRLTIFVLYCDYVEQ